MADAFVVNIHFVKMNHPLYLFKYCPKCGSKQFDINNEKSKRCKQCSFTYYFNPSAAAVAIIENDSGEVLVARRANEPAMGTLDFPGGFADLNETIEQTVIREVFEETGLVVKGYEYLFSVPNIYLYSTLEVHTMDLFFKCYVSDISTLKPQDDVSELFFMKKEDINPNDFGMQSIRTGLEIFLKM